jgi:hypothetical protein
MIVALYTASFLHSLLSDILDLTQSICIQKRESLNFGILPDFHGFPQFLQANIGVMQQYATAISPI